MSSFQHPLFIRNHKSITEEEFQCALKIWDFLFIQEELEKSDLIFVLCSHEIRVADYAVQLYKLGYADYILFSGGLNFFTKHIFKNSEAETFAEYAMEKGVAKDRIFIENQSTNTGENIEFSKKLLNSIDYKINRVIAVQKPSMTLRVKLALEKQWLGPKFFVNSPKYQLTHAPNSYMNLFMMINEILGDFQRIIEYPKLGFQSSIEIPDDLIAAYHFLISKGYHLHLL